MWSDTRRSNNIQPVLAKVNRTQLCKFMLDMTYIAKKIILSVPKIYSVVIYMLWFITVM